MKYIAKKHSDINYSFDFLARIDKTYLKTISVLILNWYLIRLLWYKKFVACLLSFCSFFFVAQYFLEVTGRVRRDGNFLPIFSKSTCFA